MGASPKYALPWPELVDSADGPDGFQDLATATENTLKVRSLRLLGQGKAETIASVEVRATPYEPAFAINLPSVVRSVIVTCHAMIAFAGNTSGAFDLYSKWDGGSTFYMVVDGFANANTKDRGYSWMFGLKNQTGGAHTGTIGLFSGAGAVLHVKSLVYSWVALG